MLSFKQDLEAHLKTDSNISSILGSRVFDTHAPEGSKFPHVVYFIISNSTDTFSGGSCEEEEVRVQFNCNAKNRHDRERLSDRLKNRLSGLNGQINSRTVVYYSKHDDSQDAPYNQEENIFTKNVDFLFKFKSED